MTRTDASKSARSIFDRVPGRRFKARQGNEPDADFGPLVSPDAKARVQELVRSGVRDGARLVVDPSPATHTQVDVVEDGRSSVRMMISIQDFSANAIQ